MNLSHVKYANGKKFAQKKVNRMSIIILAKWIVQIIKCELENYGLV